MKRRLAVCERMRQTKSLFCRNLRVSRCYGCLTGDSAEKITGLNPPMNTKNLEHKRTVRNLAIFSVVVLASGWLGLGLDALMNTPSGQQGLGMLLWLIIPLLTALLLRAFAGDGWKDFELRPLLKGNLIWYGASLLIYPLVASLVVAIGAVPGFVSAANFSISLLIASVAGGLLGSFIKNTLKNLPGVATWLPK